MNTTTSLYLFLKMTEFKEAFSNQYLLFFTILALSYCMFFLVVAFSYELGVDLETQMAPALKKTAIILISIFIFQFSCNIISTLLPSTSQLAVIVIGERTLNNERLPAISNKVLTILEKKADEYLTEMENNLNKE